MNGSSEICPVLMKRPRCRQPWVLSGAIPVADTAENHDKAEPNEREPTSIRLSDLRAQNRQGSGRESIAELFERFIKSFFLRARSAIKDSHNCSTLRDTLLPQLISGDLLASRNDGSVQEATA